MSSFNRRSLIILPFVLAACGFTPVYGPGGSGAALYGSVSLPAPSSEESYLLHRNLEERLGHSEAPKYHLTLKQRLQRQGQAVTVTGEITRFSLIGHVEYSLASLTDGSVVSSGKVDNFTGYSATGSTVETFAAENDALERLMAILADQIVAQLHASVDLPG